MSPKRVAETVTRLAQVMTPSDANILGNVFGGSILAMVDLTASATAQKFAGTICVTASFDRVDFHDPVEVGNLVEMEGHVSYVGKTSLEVTIDVFATNLAKGERTHTNTARVTMVALKDGKPTPVPRLVCETREEKIRFLEGFARRNLRQSRIEQMKHLRTKLEASTDAQLDAWLDSPDPVADMIAD